MKWNRTRFVWLLAVSMVCLSPLGAADWPMYLHDALHSSYNGDENQIGPDNVVNLQPVWTFPAAPMGGGATVSGGIVYIGDWAGNFYAIRSSDGSLIWRQFVGISSPPEDPSCQPAIGVTGQSVAKDGIVYVPGGDSAVYALDQNTGAIIWRVPLADPGSGSYIWSSLTLVNDSFYLGLASLGDCPLIRGALVRFDINDPQHPRFKYLAPSDQVGAGIWSTPAFDEQTNTVYVTTGTGVEDAETGTWGSAFMAMLPRSLAIRNHYFLPLVDPEADIEWGSSPTVFQDADGTELVAATGKDGVLYCLRRSDMTLVWSASIAVSCENPQGGCGSLSTPAFDGTTLYVGAGVSDPDSFDFGTVYAFTPSGQQLWIQSVAGPVLAPVTVANGLVYVSSSAGLIILDSATGTPLWNDGGTTTLYGQTVVVDGTVYAPYVDGSLVAYRVSGTQSAASGSVQWRQTHLHQ